MEILRSNVEKTKQNKKRQLHFTILLVENTDAVQMVLKIKMAVIVMGICFLIFTFMIGSAYTEVCLWFP